MIQGFSGGLLNRQLIYNLDLPSFQRDFASLKTLDHGTGPDITFTRASGATYFDADGVLQTAANDVPRFDHDPADGASSLGLLIEEARTNSIRNSQAGGSTNGVIGSGGVLPTNWSASGHTTNGMSTEVIGTGTENGLTYIDLKFSGTPTSTASAFFFPESSSQVVAANGQVWTGSAYFKLAAGSLTNAVVQITTSGRTVGGGNIAGQASGATLTPTTSALATQRSTTTRTMSDATVERAAFFFQINYTSGNPIDLTLRIAAPQLEQGAFPTSYIPTTTAAATRSADSAVVTPISSFYNQAEGTLFAEFSKFQMVTNSKVALFNHPSNNLRYLGFENAGSGTPTTNRFIVNNDGGGQAIITFTSAVVGTVYRNIGAYKLDDFHAAQNGTLGSADSNGTPPEGLTRLGIGTLPPSAGFPLNGHIRKIAYYPKRLTNTLLEQLTT